MNVRASFRLSFNGLLSVLALAVPPTTGARAEAVGASRWAPDDATRTALLDTIDAFFLALDAGDAAAFEKLHADGSQVVVVPSGPDLPIQRRLASETVAEMRSGAFPSIQEQYWDPVILTRDRLAVVWVPYSIDVNGARVHCGVDVFNLTRRAAGWRVDSVGFTTEPEACTELETTRMSDPRPAFPQLEFPKGE